MLFSAFKIFFKKIDIPILTEYKFSGIIESRELFMEVQYYFEYY